MILETVTNYLSIFPSWLQQTIVIFWGLAICVLPLKVVLKFIFSDELKNLLFEISNTMNKLDLFLKNQIDDPLIPKKMEKGASWIIVTTMYVMSGALLLTLVVVLANFLVANQEIGLSETLILLLFGFVTSFVAAALKTQGSRELCKLREKGDVSKHWF